jgi:hypothetical protein
MFIKPDEFIIVMEDKPDQGDFNLDDVKMLEDAGMTLAYLSCAICWDQICLPNNQMDWSSLDYRIHKFDNTNIKLLVPFYYTMPNWFPNEWYKKKDPRLTHILPNYANEDLGYAIDKFALEILDRYDDIRDRLQLTFSIPAGGEFLWDDQLTSDFPFSDEEIIKFITDRQRVLVKQHGELWLHIHTFLGHPDNWNNTHLPFVYQALRKEFPYNPLYSIQFSHFATGNIPNDPPKIKRIKEYSEKYEVQFFVGSEYCEGLSKNFDAAIEQNVRGFFTAPMLITHPLKHKHIQPWMVEALQETDRKFKELRNG